MNKIQDLYHTFEAVLDIRALAILSVCQSRAWVQAWSTTSTCTDPP